jgi:hypothetical protein
MGRQFQGLKSWKFYKFLRALVNLPLEIAKAISGIKSRKTFSFLGKRLPRTSPD